MKLHLILKRVRYSLSSRCPFNERLNTGSYLPLTERLSATLHAFEVALTVVTTAGQLRQSHRFCWRLWAASGWSQAAPAQD